MSPGVWANTKWFSRATAFCRSIFSFDPRSVVNATSDRDKTAITTSATDHLLPFILPAPPCNLLMLSARRRSYLSDCRADICMDRAGARGPRSRGNGAGKGHESTAAARWRGGGAMGRAWARTWLRHPRWDGRGQRVSKGACTRSVFRREQAISSPGVVCLPLSLEPGILERERVLQWLQVGEDRAARDGGTDLLFDALEEIVAALDGPVAGHEDVDGNEAPGAGLPGADRVEIHAAAALLL